jgi:hypothetical protein
VSPATRLFDKIKMGRSYEKINLLKNVDYMLRKKKANNNSEFVNFKANFLITIF